MSVQVLASVMFENSHELIRRMNLATDAVIVNQCDEDKVEDIEYKGRKIKFISTTERGVGKSRNLALSHATAEICIFADNDVVYAENFEEKVMQEFNKRAKNNVIFFSFREMRRAKKIYWFNALKYPTPLIAFRLKQIREANITFSLLFGGGARYSAGEDSLFITDSIKAKLNLYDSGIVIGHFIETESTWFKGFTDKYFLDKGALYYVMSKKYVFALCIQFAIRRGKMFSSEVSRVRALKLMFKGVKEFKEETV